MPPPKRLELSKIIPPGEIASAEQLMALAHALEHEAGRRYRELATRMRLQNEGSLASLFAFLANIEDKHAAEVDARAVALIGHAPDLKAVRWELPENFDEEDARSASLSPYRALAIAVRNEERAFVFYSYIAAAAESAELKQLAEEFAMEELEHASLVRRERRKAWRAQEPASRAAAEQPPETVTELLAQAAVMERAAAAAHRALARQVHATKASAMAGLFDRAADDEEDLVRSLECRLPPGMLVPGRQIRAASVRDGLRLLEDAFERYTDIAERTADEAILLEAQALAERALRRLAQVHGSLGSEALDA